MGTYEMILTGLKREKYKVVNLVGEKIINFRKIMLFNISRWNKIKQLCWQEHYCEQDTLQSIGEYS